MYGMVWCGMVWYGMYVQRRIPIIQRAPEQNEEKTCAKDWADAIV